MKLACELVGVKPLPSFTAAWWWGETKRPVRLERVLTAAEIVVGFTDRLTHLGAASALLAGTALSVVRQRQAAGDPVERGDPVIRDWATVLGLLTDAGAVVYDDDVQRLLIGPAVSASAVDDVLRVAVVVRHCESPTRCVKCLPAPYSRPWSGCSKRWWPVQDLSPPRTAPS